MSSKSCSGLLALLAWPLLACQEELPTATGPGLIPVVARSVEVRLPFETFASNLRVLGGFGSPAELGTSVVARSYQGSLDARTLVGFYAFPESAMVRDTTGTTRSDTLLTFVEGKLIAVFDTVASIHEGSVSLAAGALQAPWDPFTANWIMAVDTVGERRPWPQEGGGPVHPLGSGLWEPHAGDSLQVDSVIIRLDSAAVAFLGDTTGLSHGLLLDTDAEGVRLKVRDVHLWLVTRPGSNPDTLIELQVSARRMTFLYRPVLETPRDELWVGGVPAWRTVFDVSLPKVLDGPPELCARVTCPLLLTPERVNAANLLLTTRAPPPAFQPTDSIRLEARPVLDPGRLPKSPLGHALTGYLGVLFPAVYFQGEAGRQVSVPLGAYITDLIRGETEGGGKVFHTLALLSAFEPLSLQLAAFEGPGGPGGPVLRLVLTEGEGVHLR